MSFGEVDTLNMLFEKLNSLFDESQGYYESFLDTNNMYKQGKISDKEFFQRLGDYVVAYSALEFLAIKVLFEIKKSVNTGSGATQSPGLMPGMGKSGNDGRGGSLRNDAPEKRGRPRIRWEAPPESSLQTRRLETWARCRRRTPRSCPGSRPAPCSRVRAQLLLLAHAPRAGPAPRPNAKFCTGCGTRV